MENTIKDAIRGEGPGAAVRWTEIAAGAMAGNAEARRECARLLGHEPANMGDLYRIMDAAREVMTYREAMDIGAKATQALSAGHSAAKGADAYLSNRIGKLRRGAGMTQQQLAAKSGVNLVTLQKLENGKNRVLGAKVETVLRLAKALGVTVEELTDVQAD